MTRLHDTKWVNSVYLIFSTLSNASVKSDPFSAYSLPSISVSEVHIPQSQ